MTKKVFWWLMMVAIILLFNTATIVWIVFNFLPVDAPNLPVEYQGVISMWDANIVKKWLTPDQYLSIGEKGAIYLFMVIGATISMLFVKWLFQDTIQQAREKAKEKRDKAFKKFNKELD